MGTPLGILGHQNYTMPPSRFLPALLLLFPTLAVMAQVPGTPGLPATTPGIQTPQAPSPGYRPVPRWEYAVWEVRSDHARRKPIFQLHLPTRSSKPTENWMHSFLNSGVPIQRAGRIDEVNAMNSLGMAGWELVTISTKESVNETVVHHYFKRPTYYPNR